jgi:hypothetical protein
MATGDFEEVGQITPSHGHTVVWQQKFRDRRPRERDIQRRVEMTDIAPAATGAFGTIGMLGRRSGSRPVARRRCT